MSLQLKLMKSAVLVMFCTGLLVFAAACAAVSGAETAIPATPTVRPVTPTSLAVAQAITPQPTAQVPAGSTASLRIWWPEPLAPVEQGEISVLLDRQVSAFVIAEDGEIEVDFRLKRYQDVGGLVSMLRATSPVAPGAMPDVALIRREDLLSLVQAGIVQPLDGISTAIVEDIYGAALTLGRIDDQLYGLPYTLDMLMLAYRAIPDAELPVPSSFNAVLEREQPFLFPARRLNSINTTFLLQYLDAGGELPDASGGVSLDPEALFSVLSFYEQAYRQNLVGSSVFEFSTPFEYQTQLTTGSVDMAVINARMYLDLQTIASRLQTTSIPTLTGEPITMINGWLWVLTTSNPDRQQVATRFINWMMDVDHHEEYALTARMIPTQRVVMQRLDGGLYDSQFISALMNRAIIQPPDDAIGVMGRSMQNALNAVLSGEMTADEAAQTVITQLGG